MNLSRFLVAIALSLTLLPLSAFAKTEHAEKKSDAQAQHRWLNQTVRGSLTTLNGSTLTLLVGGVSFQIDASTATFTHRSGGTMTLNDLQLKDELIVHGTWVDGGILKAKKVQDMSLQKRSGTFAGAVLSLESTSTTNSFVMTTHKREKQTITWNAETKITKNGVAASSSEILIGRNVRVHGTWNRTNSNVMAKTIAITVPLVRTHVIGQVTAINDGTITVLSEGKTYLISLRKSVLMFSQYQHMKAKDIHVGDRVDVWARGEKDALTLQAYFVHDLSQMNNKTHVITIKDLGMTRTLEVGDRLLVRLSDGFTWTNASSSNVNVLAPVVGTSITFSAKAVGASIVSVNGDPICRSATPACAAPSTLFHVNVNVVAATL